MDSLAASGAQGFDFFILSDSTDPANWVAEEVAWQRLRLTLEPEARVFYRHRHRNVGRKSGNIQDFCENWGAAYDYMLVLDADSVMSGETLNALVRLMDANPKRRADPGAGHLGGPQHLLCPHPAIRLQRLWPNLQCGTCWLQGGDGNYWGHNAIIRVRAFQSSRRLAEIAGTRALWRRDHEP